VPKRRVVLAIESRMFREALGERLEQTQEVEVVDQATDPVGLLAAVARTAADVVVQALPPHLSGAICAQMQREFPELVVIDVFRAGDSWDGKQPPIQRGFDELLASIRDCRKRGGEWDSQFPDEEASPAEVCGFPPNSA